MGSVCERSMSETCMIHVAIIDGDESICRSMSRLLKAAGMESKTFASGELFLSQCKNHHFDCVLLDIQLDGMSGLELYDELNHIGFSTPVLFITSNDAADVRTQAQDAGCAGFFRKSDPGAELLSAIHRVASKPLSRISP